MQMLKRLATLLLGVGLIGLGVLLFAAPGGTSITYWLAKLWPVFLILGGLVRLAGFLIDRHPHSPVVGMMITAIGGILLAANFRGDRSLLVLFGNYWFWLLLALVIGRILRQSLHRIEDGPRPRSFSPGASFLMILLMGGGLTSNYLAKHRTYLNGVEFRLGQLGQFGFLGSEFLIENDPPQEISLSPEMRLLINNFKGSVEISAIPQASSTARLIKRIRANSQEEADEIAKSIHLQLTPSGRNLQFKIASDNLQNDFNSTLVITFPSQTIAGLEANEITGKIKLSGLHGDHVLRNTDRVEINDNSGKVTVENPRGSVELNRIQGAISLSNVRSNLSLHEINGPITLDARNSNVSVEQASGPIQARLSDVRLTLNEITKISSKTLNDQPIVKLTDASNCRLNLQQIKGTVTINAERSRIEAENISGDLTVKNSSERVQINRISGALKINSENSTIEIEEVHGAAEIEATRDVTVRSFHGALNILSSSGTISLATDEKLAGNIKATTQGGRIRLSLPEDSGFKLDAGTDSGRVRLNGFDGLNIPSHQKQVAIEHNASPGSPVIVLRSSSGNIELQSSGLALASRNEEQ